MLICPRTCRNLTSIEMLSFTSKRTPADAYIAPMTCLPRLHTLHLQTYRLQPISSSSVWGGLTQLKALRLTDCNLASTDDVGSASCDDVAALLGLTRLQATFSTSIPSQLDLQGCTNMQQVRQPYANWSYARYTHGTHHHRSSSSTQWTACLFLLVANCRSMHVRHTSASLLPRCKCCSCTICSGVLETICSVSWPLHVHACTPSHCVGLLCWTLPAWSDYLASAVCPWPTARRPPCPRFQDCHSSGVRRLSSKQTGLQGLQVPLSRWR